MRNWLKLSVFSFGLMAYSCSSNKVDEAEPKNETEIVEEAKKNELFGIDLDEYVIKYDTVKRNWTLSHMLLPYGISQGNVNKAFHQTLDTAVNLKYIVPKSAYQVLCYSDTAETPAYCIYKKNEVDYFIFDFRDDTVVVKKHQKEVVTVEKEASGIVTSSLWNAFVDNDLPTELASKVISIYSWSIDFFGVQKNDFFKVIYDEKFVDGKSIGVGKIKAMVFNNMNEDHYSFFYDNDTVAGYFDTEGGSLKKALLSAPLSYRRISSRFSHRRFHPVLKIYRPHHGVDYAARAGTPVVSVGDGVVIAARFDKGAGNYIKIQHPNKILTKYLHLGKFAPGIRKGVKVKQGQFIGEVGSTGYSTGPHLDYRLYINGKPTNPLSADLPPSDPLPEKYLEAYGVEMNKLKDRLEKISLKVNKDLL